MLFDAVTGMNWLFMGGTSWLLSYSLMNISLKEAFNIALLAVAAHILSGYMMDRALDPALRVGPEPADNLPKHNMTRVGLHVQ